MLKKEIFSLIQKPLENSRILSPSGWIVIDKAYGMTSTRVGSAIKRAFKQKKCGHAGTLDPLASGVLPIALGKATKTIPFMVDVDKEYAFDITFGEGRDTDDAQGQIIEKSDYIPNEMEIQSVLHEFTGAIAQIPPLYSAIKIHGQRAYNLARKGEMPDLKSRLIQVYDLKILSMEENVARMHVHCGKGTYVRSLARDIAHRLNSCGYISFLRRTRVGKFTLEDAIELEKILELGHNKEEVLLPVGVVLDDIPAISVTNEEAMRLCQGQSLSIMCGYEDQKVSLWQDDNLIALAEVENGLINPKKVFI